jgi:hypothetical protein
MLDQPFQNAVNVSAERTRLNQHTATFQRA